MADVPGKFFTAVKVRTGVSPSSPGSQVGEAVTPVNPPGTSLVDYVTYTGAIKNVELGEYGVEAGFITLDTTPTNTPTDQGTIFWDVDDETVDIVLNGYTMKIGEDLFYPVKNQTGSTIAKGTAVRFNGTVGASGRLLIAPFIADGSVPSSRFMGVTAEEILNGEDGKVLYFGRIRGINTDAFNEGDILYASTTVAGGFQTAIPVSPNNIVQVAAVVTKHVNNGTIFVRPTLGSNLNTDEAVKLTSVADKNLLQYQSGTALWENKTLAQVLGGTSSQFVKGDGSLDSTAYGTGTVTSVGLYSATSGVTIGSTPVTTSGTITLAIATASGSQNGLLSSTDWTTFNSKQNALTNPVTGTGASGQVTYWSSGSAITGSSNFLFDASQRNLNIDRSLSTLGNAITISKGSDVDQAWLAFKQGGGASGTWRLGYTGDPYDFRINVGSDSSIGTQALRIFLGTQNVVIGTATGDNGARLQVSGTATFSGDLGVGRIPSSGYKVDIQGNGGLRILDNDILRSIVILPPTSSSQGVVSTASGQGISFQATNASGNLFFETAGNERMRITSSGNVGIGDTNPTSSAGWTPKLVLNATSAALVVKGINGQENTFGTSNGLYIDSLGNSTGTNNNIIFRNSNSNSSFSATERMRITSGGFLKASNTGTYLSSTGAYHEINSNVVNDWSTIIRNTSALPYGLQIAYSGASPNSTANQFIWCPDGTALRFEVRSNGGIANFQANDVNFSDERTKKEIAPLESYWDKFKAIEIVKFKYKDQTHDDFNIGVIAQQVESVAPEFVDVDGWDTKPKLDEEGNEIVSEEEPLKSIYTADLYHATIKVLQEAMAKIESMQKEIDTLKN